MIVELLEKTDTISAQFVLNGYQELANTYAPSVYGLICLSVIIFGYAIVLGWVNLSLAEIGKRLLTVGFVLSLALNWGTFSNYIYDLFTKVPNEISIHILKSLPNVHYSDIGGINSALDQTWSDGVGFAAAMWERGDWHHWFPYLWACIILLLIILLVGIALIELVVAKFGLAIFLVISPLIIPMMLFRASKEIIFDGWLKHIVTFAFVPVFVTSALALCLTLMSDSVGDIKLAIQADELAISAAAPYAIYLFVCIGLVIKATQMAASIANGFSIGMTPVTARAVGAMRREIDRYRRPNGNPNKPKLPIISTASAIVSNPSTLSTKV